MRILIALAAALMVTGTTTAQAAAPAVLAAPNINVRIIHRLPGLVRIASVGEIRWPSGRGCAAALDLPQQWCRRPVSSRAQPVRIDVGRRLPGYAG